jgi:hypothetical protein
LIVDLATVHRESPTASFRTRRVFARENFVRKTPLSMCASVQAKVFSRTISGEDFAKRKADKFRE